MSRAVVILDDEPERIELMLAAIAHLEGYHPRTFDNAPALVAFLDDELTSTPVALMSLDHDLGPSRLIDGERREPGIGRDVTDRLVTLAPSFPILVHTSNGPAGTGMVMDLEQVGWSVHRVRPVYGHTWIDRDWCDAVHEILEVPRPR